MPENRSIAWRRAQRAKYAARVRQDNFKPRYCVEKSWKNIYFRSRKLQRAKTLGKVWPRREWVKLLEDSMPLNVLFVCSQNKWRSPTAENVWKKVSEVAVRSAGTSRKARRNLSVADIRWADMIFVMEEKHKSRIVAAFRDEVKYKKTYVLDIPDDYKFMDPELIEILREKTESLIFEALDSGR